MAPLSVHPCTCVSWPCTAREARGADLISLALGGFDQLSSYPILLGIEGVAANMRFWSHSHV